MAILKIYNDIATEETKMEYWWNGSDAVCFKDISQFIAAIPSDDDKIELRLNCRGGNVQEGWAIYDALRATGKEISAVIEGKCASMATIVLCAAKKELRSAQPNSSLCIHSPCIPEYTLSGAYKAEDLRKMAEDLENEHERFLDIYVERTGANREELDALMKEDKYVSMERAKELGFISTILTPKSAQKTETKMAKKKGFKQAFMAFMAAIAAEEDAVAMDLTTESGDMLTVEREEGEPQVGDVASPDGEHVMPDGKTIVVTDGAITEIREPEDSGDGSSELEEANAKIADLEAKLAQATAVAKTDKDIRILNAVATAGGEKWLEKQVSGYKASKTEFKGKVGVQPVETMNPFQKELDAKRAARQERFKNRK